MEIFPLDVSLVFKVGLVFLLIFVIAVTFVFNFNFNKKQKEEKNNQMVNISNNKNVSGINVSQNIFNNSVREE